MDGHSLQNWGRKEKAGKKQGAAFAPQRRRHGSSVPLGTRFEAQGTGLLTCAKLDYLPGAAAPVVAAIQASCRYPQRNDVQTRLQLRGSGGFSPPSRASLCIIDQ